MEANELRIGSTIFSLNYFDLKNLFTRDYSSNKEVMKEIIKKTEVYSLSISKEGLLLVNESYDSYRSKTNYFLKIEKTEFKNSLIKREETLYFFNEEDYFQLIRKGVLRYLDKIEKSIETYKLEQIEKYKQVQKHYWDYLQ